MTSLFLLAEIADTLIVDGHKAESIVLETPFGESIPRFLILSCKGGLVYRFSEQDMQRLADGDFLASDSPLDEEDEPRHHRLTATI